MNNKNLDGLSIIFVEFTETGGKWNIEVIAAETYAYTDHWMRDLQNVADISVLQFQLLHASFGKYIGEQINNFINQFNLQHKVHLISSNGHTVFTIDKNPVNLQLGSGASIALLR